MLEKRLIKISLLTKIPNSPKSRKVNLIKDILDIPHKIRAKGAR